MMPATPTRMPLSGVTVIALEQAIAAPLATRHLADLGARVIKVEQPTFGDSTRSYDQAAKGYSAHFAWLNHGKESAALDLKSGRDFDVVSNMLESADVVVSNLAPGALDRLGLGLPALAERYPQLVIINISGYGKGGTYDDKRAYDLLIQAEAGSCAITGEPGRPAKPGIPIADIGTAMYVYSSALAALYDREKSGRGAVIEISMLDVVAEYMGFALNQVIHTGREPEAVGMGSPMVAPYSSYRTSDGQTVVLGTTNDREWQRLAGLIGHPELGNDVRYARNESRVQVRAEVDTLVAGWCSQHSLQEIQELADAAGIGNARYNTVADLAKHPQLAERGRWREIDSSSGPLPALRPVAMSREWTLNRGRLPDLGEHTESTRAEFGGNQQRAVGTTAFNVV